ncbi:hypothetical protein AMTRI_Chr05g69470 [Amborella trichopoda]|uniref:SHSP domain-containing protein n=1 Tax=Amborella trichopoda TaxID=13333 RepID=W1NFI2_AMBTC|nr:17.3 kDa class I heat shock protein [Amborella trichopoda]ERM93964.1 hypothetical protein AMTR_s00136p00020380 [Amborella trichopoda]|eukprot:XP_006826727.1 17.3 kDa class I heat shock protein [Amborella trichopoda]
MALVPSFWGPQRSSIYDPFALDIWDPFEAFTGSAVAFPRGTTDDVAPFVNARFDWKETDDAHMFKADLPGVRKDEVKVELEDGRVLKISGERRKEVEEKGDTWHRIERSQGRFLRRFRLPENAKVDAVKATMETGVLTVVVPKGEATPKSDVKAIKIN